MKKLSSIFLLSAGILLLLTGCKQKIDNLAGKAVSLKLVANYGVPSTRTAYSGDGTWVDPNDHSKGLSWERIDWLEGDEVLIWADGATVREDGEHPVYGTTHIATYTLYDISTRNENRESVASISDNTGLGLRYDDGAGSYTFWGIYPASAVVGTAAPTTSSVSYKIDGSQTCTATGPDMQKAVMLSVLEGASATANNEMEFYPAFTAYQFDITTKSDDSFTLKSIKLSSADGTTPLWGTVAATIAAEGASTYSVSNGGSTITCTLQSPLEISSTKHAVATIFANPNGSEGVKVSFVLGTGNDGVDVVRTATLKKNNALLSFDGCKKHVIKGIIIPTDAYFDKITLRLQVQGWDEYTVADAAASDYVQTTQFTVQGENVMNGRDDLELGSDKRQYWYFAPTGVATVSFKVMLPIDGEWSVVPVDPDGVFSVTNVSPDATSATTLSGHIGDNGSTVVKLEIRYTSTDASRHQLYLRTFATKNGNTYSLDSETQLFDIRGYHYFIVNDPAYNSI